jgi:hypothetical protein
MHYIIIVVIIIIIIIIIIYILHKGDLKLAYMPQITMSLGYIIERYSVITIYEVYIIIIIIPVM